MKFSIFFENYKVALTAVKSSRTRSILTLIGIIVGVVSVVTVMSLGEGVKHQVEKEANRLGGDILVIKPEAVTPSDLSFSSIKNGAGPSVGALNENDIKAANSTSGVDKIAPMATISGVPARDKFTDNSAIIVGTNHKMPKLAGVKLDFGNFFNEYDTDEKAAVIGSDVADKLFKDVAPVGQTIKIRDQDFIVRGVLEKNQTDLLGLEINFNKAVFIPYNSAITVSGDTANIYEILVKTKTVGSAKDVANNLTKSMLASHGNQHDFSIMKPGDNVLMASSVLRLITGLVTSVAIIAMLIGGISIMNIMLVSVTERTHEIGIRKAVGATDRQIGMQFMMEAIVLSVWGAIFGLILSGFINVAIRLSTDFQPIITWQPAVLAVVISIFMGVVFGTMPAIKASKKDPIEALRSSE